ncbi:hypothetical protein GLAREA_02431 [Glarea lozoyensis ATCC 20868]|uniref:Uncharacterized protein n=1 Tax=Glarea lozoyensis (strain ATCC 20868 / MF5171) TaxID=1116229 RepID=S3DIZ2_GLAL2|nr:uncharacterized protein GLAREA_02431 [Glarea lozoyensis ATCC 20868]EPE26518.1 hypothetical protein GLAREA_02431 [Glarea lozoyensis ATCC 20868]
MATNATSEFDKQNTETDDIPQGGDTVDNSYATSGKEPLPVVTDETPVEQPNDLRNPDSDAALGKQYSSSQNPDFSLGDGWEMGDVVPEETGGFGGKGSMLMFYVEQDEKEAIDTSNVLKGDRTRHAKPVGTYREPGDEEGLPRSVLNGEDGHSATR